nr:NAD-dependent DNA ligase LigA [uncultured Oscillibacter sp.]
MAWKEEMGTQTETELLKEMKELTEKLNEASRAYYAQDVELMSNLEYDSLYTRLEELEAATGVVLVGSPTIHVGYEAVDELPKERHESRMLSLDKTKEREELREFLKDSRGMLSWKLDGLTVVLHYQEGKLIKAVTRGNGEVGEIVTNNARVFQNIPLQIAFSGELVLRGEAIITYSDFARINEEIGEDAAKYKNPRNLCSGSVRQLNNEITAGRRVRFYAFSLVRADGMTFENSREKQMLFLKKQGFEIVEYRMVTGDTVLEAVAEFEQAIQTYDVPSDGLVLCLDDLEYSRRLGSTTKFPRDSIAFKWADEQAETTLREIEWSASRTGLINPVAVFEPVELEGTTVSRASVHNVSIVKSLKLGYGDRIMVYKANMIIPQIARNLTESGSIVPPAACPVCGGDTAVRKTNEVEALYCLNPDCGAKKIKSFTLFASRDAMNIDGLSEATLEKLIGKGLIHHYADMFHLDRYRAEIVEMEGFGERSFQNLTDSIERARNTTLPRLIYSLGIENIGLANAKVICRAFGYDLERMRSAGAEELSEIDGIGEVIAASFHDYFAEEKNKRELELLLPELSILVEQIPESELTLQGMVFVITGSLQYYENRNALKEEIEKRGGKVSGSVSSKTSGLINNDTTSNSSKNKKARELGIPVISEEIFRRKYLQ